MQQFLQSGFEFDNRVFGSINRTVELGNTFAELLVLQRQPIDIRRGRALFRFQCLLFDLLSMVAFPGLLQFVPVCDQALLQLRLLLQHAGFQFRHLLDLLQKFVTFGAIGLQLVGVSGFQILEFGQFSMQLPAPGLHLFRMTLPIAQLLLRFGKSTLQLRQRFLILIPFLFESLQTLAIAVITRFHRHCRLSDIGQLGSNLLDFLGPCQHAGMRILVAQLQDPIAAGPQSLLRNQAFARLQLRPLAAQIG